MLEKKKDTQTIEQVNKHVDNAYIHQKTISLHVTVMFNYINVNKRCEYLFFFFFLPSSSYLYFFRFIFTFDFVSGVLESDRNSFPITMK